MNNKTIAILQSNYIPWKGYFDMINLVDEFVLYDDVQYTKRDWRNRNLIKTKTGRQWLTIPVETKGKRFQSIKDTRIADGQWMKKHWNAIVLNYQQAKHFKDHASRFEALYLNSKASYLSEVNYRFIKAINDCLGIKTKISWSGDYCVNGDRSERLLNICKQAKATTYISGPAAKDYLDTAIFDAENISVKWMDYSGYPEYNQLYPPFVHEVSVIDLIFNEGEGAKKFMKSF